MNSTAFERVSAILMARFVGSGGEALRPNDVVALTYSLYELDEHLPGEQRIVGGGGDVRLDAGEVFFDSLQWCDLWMADGVGYNFRHELDLPVRRSAAKRRSYRIQYVITPTCGRTTRVSFQVRAIRR